jgi:hypothetical protein
MFECIYINKQSSNSIPTFSSVLKDFTEDNEIIWVTKKLNTADSAWQANHDYKKGDSIKQGNFSYECIGFIGTSGASEPNYKTSDVFEIIDIDQPNKKFTIDGNKVNHMLVNDLIDVRNSSLNDGIYTVVSVSLVSGDTVVEVSEPINDPTIVGEIVLEDPHTYDGNIAWEFYPSDINIIDYDWNDYIKITSSVTLLT